MLSKRITGGAPAPPISWPSAGAPPPDDAAPEPPPKPHAGGREDAQQAFERIRQEAFEEGAGSERRHWAPRLQAAEERLARAVADVASCKARLRREVEREMVELALAIARKVVRRELTVDPAALAGIARAALDRVSARDIVRVRVAPAGREPLQKALAELDPDAEVTVEADASLAAGGLVIETARGTLDASIDGQLEEIENGLADRLEARR